MKVMQGPLASWEPFLEGSAVAVGVFDGVHLGHRQVIAGLIARAEQLGRLTPAVLTFDPHPLELVSPARAPRLLTSIDQRLEQLARAGVVATGVLPFTEEIRELKPDEFCEQVLVNGMRARLVAVGDDFRFGRNRTGGVDELRKLGDYFGFEVDVMDLLREDDNPVSSTAIRRAVADGRVEEAAVLLGRRFELRGEVVPGETRGATIGFPTANLANDPAVIIPGRGVYAAYVHLGVDSLPAVVNVGVRPTFDGETETVVEAHILDFDANLYGEELAIVFVQRLRDEQKFGSVEALVQQIGHDVEATRSIFAS